MSVLKRRNCYLGAPVTASLLAALVSQTTSATHQLPTTSTTSTTSFSQPYHRHVVCLEKQSSLAFYTRKIRGGGGGRESRDYGYYGSSYDNDRYDNRQSSTEPRRSDGRSKDDPYDDYKTDDYYPPKQRNNDDSESSSFQLPSVLKRGNRQIGLALLGSGAVIVMFGISLFFNKTLMRLGNLLFIAGVPMTIGPTRTAGYFLNKEKYRATACLALGIFLVFVGMPVLGMILEVFGILNLFGNMFPVLLAVAKQMPVIGPILKGNHQQNNKNDRRRRDDYDQHDDYHYSGRDFDRGYDQQEDSPREDRSDRYY